MMNSAFNHILFLIIANLWPMAMEPVSFKNHCVFLAALVMAVLSANASVHAGDPAWPGYHPLSQTQAGSLLISELGCAGCHDGVPSDTIPRKTAPDLVDVGNRISPDFLQQFLEAPSVTHPGTTMPDVLVSRPESERKSIAEALTHFLVSLSKPAVPTEPTDPIDRERGRRLFHSIGCVACHGPIETRADLQRESESNEAVDEDQEPEEAIDPARAARKAIQPNAVPLAHVAAKYSLNSLSDFLFEPLRVRSSGRMPDMKLTPTEARDIAGYLIGEATPTHARLPPDAALIEDGRKHFLALNCNACHALPGIPAHTPVHALNASDLAAGCLSEAPHSLSQNRSPRYSLDSHQRAAIASALRETVSDDSARVTVAKSLTAFRCVACHVRDDFGGVHDVHNSFFQGNELNMGDDGRIPPPLTLIGAKLKPAWMKKVLFDGESVRHYMVTRMPQYGSHNLQRLPELFRQLDVLSGPEMKIPNPESRSESEREHEKRTRAAGRELLGDKAANCVACHQFNGKAANVNQGIDLLTSYERLQPEWFNRYLRNPGAFRPRTVMPSAWPDGISAFNAILDGDTDRQIEAIWYYLSLGTSAADPPGVRAVNTKIEVGDQTRVHRGRSRVAGFRGIAVGLPEKISYAFNAETGTLSAIWVGEFIGVNWSGQGSGDFNPAREPIQLAQDVSFTALPDEDSPWPLLPTMTKDAPTNPNPLYPKNVGYQFRGYFLDDQSIPTFMYRIGTVAIEDRPFAVVVGEQRQLRRHLQFESPTPQTLWFRALTGDVHRESDHTFRHDRLRFIIPPIESKLRRISDATNQAEVLLRLDIPQGKSTLEFTYEPLSK